MTSSPGTLYVVATPIGNLEDVTLRALRVLREVDLIAAEDTRRSLKLLTYYGIRKPLVSLREHNEARESGRLVAKLAAGQNIALVSDAGTPAIADPGARLVRTAREAGCKVVPIPGPSAITAALSVSGIDCPEFVFMGYPPPAGTSRAEWLERASDESRTVIFFEAPHRLRQTIDNLRPILVNRPIISFRELTKIHETYGIRPITYGPKDGFETEIGEFTVILGPILAHAVDEIPMSELVDEFGRLIECGVFTASQAIIMLAGLHGASPRLIKKTLKKARILANRSKSTSA